MPQWRKLHTKITESMDVNDMPDDFTRLLWVLLPTQLCREGRGVDNPSWVRAKVFPLREDVTLDMVSGAMDWYERRGMIERYEVEGRSYFAVPTFGHYQGNTRKEAESEYPAPPSQVETNCGPTPEQVAPNSGTDSDADADSDTDSEVMGADAPAPTAPAAVPSPRKLPSGLTVAGKEFFAQFGRQRWGTKAERERFEATEREVGSTVMMAAVRWAAENRIARVPAICSTARKMHQEGTGKPRASPSRARLPPNAGRPEYEDPAVYQRAVEAYERGDTG